jgi:hypothetical protein
MHPKGTLLRKPLWGTLTRTCSTRAYGQFSSSFFFSMKVFRTQKGVATEATMTMSAKDAGQLSAI